MLLARWRVPVMFGVYVLFFLHVALWHAWGDQRIGHLGFGEFFGTLRSGVVTAGTIFTVVVFLHALCFGGLFCGWACHWGIIQDLIAAIYRRLGIVPRMIRVESPWVPWAWFLVILGQVGLTWWHAGLPTSLTVNLGATPVWSGVPRSLVLICLTTIISGFLLVFLFGERAFCRLICTFRLWFAWFERAAPHTLVARGDCPSCRRECSAVCPMGLDVAGEILARRELRDPACIKCGECVIACPATTLQTTLRRPWKGPQADAAYSPPAPDLDRWTLLFPSLVSIWMLVSWCFELGGNVSMSLGFVIGFFAWRTWTQRRPSPFELVVLVFLLTGLYFRIDLDDGSSLVKGLAALGIFLGLVRLVAYPEGSAFLAGEAATRRMPAWAVVLVLAPLLFVSFREARLAYHVRGVRAARDSHDLGALSCTLEQLAAVIPEQAATLREAGAVHLQARRWAEAEEAFRRSHQQEAHPGAVWGLYRAARGQHRDREAERLLEEGLASFPAFVPLLWEKARLLEKPEDLPALEQICIRILTEDPDDQAAHLVLGKVLVQQNRLAEAENEFDQAVASFPREASALKARLLARMGRHAEAAEIFEWAVRFAPTDPTLRFDQGLNLAATDHLEEAIAAWEAVLQIDPTQVEARHNIEAARQRLLSRSVGGAPPPAPAATASSTDLR